MPIAETVEQADPCVICHYMSNDHLRLDQMFMEADQALRDGRTESAEMIRHFIEALGRHMQIEHELLIAIWPGIHKRTSDDPVCIVRREHEAIVTQVAVLKGLATVAHDSDLGALGVWMGLLGAALVKHECQQETEIFPKWERMVTRGIKQTGIRGRPTAPLAVAARETAAPEVGICSANVRSITNGAAI